MEPSDAHSESASEARTTTPTNSLPHATISCPSALIGVALPSPSEAFTSSISQAEKHSGELLQCSLPRPIARNHFPLPGSRRTKHRHEGRQAQPLHSNVLKPKPTICHVWHTLGQARRR